MPSQARSGLSIAGCEAACGKTVVMTGLAGAMREQGLRVRAIKPLVASSRSQAESELRFLSTISQTAQDYPVRYLDGSEVFSSFHWQETLRLSATGVEPVLFELPGGTTLPLVQDAKSGRWLDAGDLASQLNLPCLLVAREGPLAFEQLVLNSNYLIRASGVRVVGLVTVETAPIRPDRLNQTCAQTREAADDGRAIALLERCGVPYLGCLRFSPSINVELVNQGNLIKTTSAGFDLLPLLECLNIRLTL